MHQSLEGVETLARWVAGVVLRSYAMAIADPSAAAPAARSTGVHGAVFQLKLGITLLAAPFRTSVPPRLGAAYGAATGSRAGQRE